MKWTLEFKKKGIRRGFLSEPAYYLVIGVFRNYITEELYYIEEVLIWDRVKYPTRRAFIDFIKEVHDPLFNGLFTSLSCVSKFSCKEEAEAYESNLGNDLVKTMEMFIQERMEDHES